MTEEKKQAPIQTLRDGAVVVKLWRQDGPKGPYVTATLGRTYRDEQSGEYRESRSLSSSEVLKGHALLLEAHREIGRWRTFFRETEAKPEQRAQGGLLEQRDAALSKAKTPNRTQSRDRGPQLEI